MILEMYLKALLTLIMLSPIIYIIVKIIMWVADFVEALITEERED